MLLLVVCHPYVENVDVKIAYWSWRGFRHQHNDQFENVVILFSILDNPQTTSRISFCYYHLAPSSALLFLFSSDKCRSTYATRANSDHGTVSCFVCPEALVAEIYHKSVYCVSLTCLRKCFLGKTCESHKLSLPSSAVVTSTLNIESRRSLRWMLSSCVPRTSAISNSDTS